MREDVKRICDPDGRMTKTIENYEAARPKLAK